MVVSFDVLAPICSRDALVHVGVSHRGANPLSFFFRSRRLVTMPVGGAVRFSKEGLCTRKEQRCLLWTFRKMEGVIRREQQNNGDGKGNCGAYSG